MKIYCHRGIYPNIDVLSQYGIKIITTFESPKELEPNSYIIELPETLKLIREIDMPDIISGYLRTIIIDENGNIVCSMYGATPVNYQYESENVSAENMYDYHSFGAVRFYKKGYPSLNELVNMSREDMDKLMDILEEMYYERSEEDSKTR